MTMQTRKKRHPDIIVGDCIFCGHHIDHRIDGEPVIIKNEKIICMDCAFSLLDPIYFSLGTGGLAHIVFTALLQSSHNRKKRKPMSGYKRAFKTIAKKYKFKCVTCGTDKNLTLDHIKPVSKGGTDDFSNLQLMCRSCNSRKGAKYDG